MHHRQAHAHVRREFVEDVGGQPARLATENEGIAGRKHSGGETALAARAQREEARGRLGGEYFGLAAGPVGMAAHGCEFRVVHAGPAQPILGQLEAERLDEVQA